MSSKCNLCGQPNALGLPLTRHSLCLDGDGYRLSLCVGCADRVRAAVMSFAWYSGDADDPKQFHAGYVPETPVPVVAASVTAHDGRRIRPQDIRIPFPVIQRGDVEVLERPVSAVAAEALDGLPKELARELVETYTMTAHVRAEMLQSNMLPIRVMYAAHLGTTLDTKSDGTLVRQYEDITVMVDPKTNRIVKAYRSY